MHNMLMKVKEFAQSGFKGGLLFLGALFFGAFAFAITFAVVYGALWLLSLIITFIQPSILFASIIGGIVGLFSFSLILSNK